MTVSFETRAGQKIAGTLEGNAPDHCISVRVEKGPRFAKGKVLLFPKNGISNYRQSAA